VAADEVAAGAGRIVPGVSHPVLSLLSARAAAGSRVDGHRLALVIEGGGMRGVVSAAMTAALDDLGYAGCFDLVVGTFPGSFSLFNGQRDGKFLPKPDEMKAGDQPLRIEGNHGDPFVIDWDGDGDLDILSGSSEGGVQWAENRAGPGRLPRK